MTFNILQGGGEAANVGFDNRSFDGSRVDELAEVIQLANADIVGVQEDCGSNELLDALGPHWTRIGNIYARVPLEKISVAPYLTIVRAELPNHESLIVVNCHWFPPRGGYGPDLAMAELRNASSPTSLAAASERIVARCSVPDGPRGYNATLKPLSEHLGHEEAVVLTGDFNEPSHLDWTERYAKEGRDRWVNNPTSRELNFAVPWPGSTQLAEIGMIDSYRAVHPDEVQHRGITWTPYYKKNTPGRRSYDDQILDRIDRIYHAGSILQPIAAAVVGEPSEETDLVYPRRWPSDHRAVVVTFRLAGPAKAPEEDNEL